MSFLSQNDILQLTPPVAALRYEHNGTLPSCSSAKSSKLVGGSEVRDIGKLFGSVSVKLLIARTRRAESALLGGMSSERASERKHVSVELLMLLLMERAGSVAASHTTAAACCS